MFQTLVGHTFSVTSTQFCHCSEEIAITINDSDYILIKLNMQKQAWGPVLEVMLEDVDMAKFTRKKYNKLRKEIGGFVCLLGCLQKAEKEEIIKEMGRQQSDMWEIYQQNVGSLEREDSISRIKKQSTAARCFKTAKATPSGSEWFGQSS